jgi:hypothetical protein
MAGLNQVYPLVNILEISTGEVNWRSMYGSRSLLLVHHVEVPELYTSVASAMIISSPPSKLFDACTMVSGANVRLLERITSSFLQPEYASNPV